MIRNDRNMEETNIEDLAENQPSLCIPRVWKNIDTNRIRSSIDSARLGKIERIDIVERRNANGEITKRIFIHFQKWYCNEVAQNARKRLVAGKDIKIVYEFPWFWKVSANKVSRHKHHNHRERNVNVKSHNHTKKVETSRVPNVEVPPLSPILPPKHVETMDVPRAPLMKKKMCKIIIPESGQEDIYVTPSCPIACDILEDVDIL